MNPCVLHLDFDAFFASVEQLRNPRLRGRPVIVGNGVIASCSYEARRFGCAAGMPLRQARRLCPRGIFLDGNYAVYRCFADRAFQICGEITAGVETYLDEAYGDLSGTERYYGNYLTAGQILRRRVSKEVGLSVTVGLGPNRMIAKMAGKSVKPNGLREIAIPEVETFLRDRAVDDLPGIGPATARTLQHLGIHTVADLRALSLDDLQALFGAHGIPIYERCHGRDSIAIHDREVPRTISRETTFHHETSDLDEVRAMLYYLTERAMRSARSLGVRTRAVAVRIGYADFTRDGKSRVLPEPTSLDRDVYETAAELLRSIYVRRVALRHVGIVLSHFSRDLGQQMPLFDERQELRLRSLYRSVDRIRDRFGHASLIVGRSLDLLGKLEQDGDGYVLRTPSLTR